MKTRVNRGALGVALLLGLGLAMGSANAAAAPAGPPLRAAQPPTEIVNLPELPVLRSSGGVFNATLQLDYAFNQLGPWSDGTKNDTVKLRSYNGQLVGPTFRVKPGDVLNIRMENKLPCLQPPCTCKDGPALEHVHVATVRDSIGSAPVPAVYNTTNLHTHGLHISPRDPADNVLREILPGCGWNFRFEIPRDHPAGTFWYHPHVHGSTSIQVGSGAVGALIVEGGIDEIPEIKAAKEEILLFQQIPYKCAAKTANPSSLCTQGDPGVVEDFEKDFGNGVWPAPWQYTSINGVAQPTLVMGLGEVKRWRMIHGGVRESIFAAVARYRDSTPLPGWLHEIALDGLATGEIVPRTSIELQPGYRVDVLVKAPMEPGIFYLLDQESPAGASLLAEPEAQKILAEIVVLPVAMEKKLPTNAQLAPFRLPSVTDAEVKGRPLQKVEFNIDREHGKYTVDGAEFPHGKIRQLQLGKADEWLVTSLFANHPYHIHVNPFEVIEPLPGGGERRYWKDTMLIKPGPGVRLRSRYQVYDGRFVIHCHILDHEDRGMMQLVEIVP